MIATAQKITWKAPTDPDIIYTEVSRSETLYGTYTVLGTVAADTTSYTDLTGARTHWYRVRFYDGTHDVWSEYSDPTTAEELLRLCTVDEVKRTINTIGRWTDDQIFDAITDVDNLIFIECGTPVQSAVSAIGKIDDTLQDKYYVGEENIYRVDRVFYGTTTKVELYLDDGYKANNTYGMIKILPVASSGVTLDTTCEVEIQYVPKIYNQLSLYRTCKRLLEQLDFTSGGTTSKELETINKKLEDVERLLAHRIGVQISSDLKNYDPIYGVNRKRVIQNHHRNNYIGSTGWD